MAATRIAVGAWFRPEDYAGFGRRIAIDAIDLGVMGIVLFLVSLWPLGDVDVFASPASWELFLAIGFVNLVLLKGSRVRTLGHRLTRTRMVDISGNDARFGVLAERFLFLAMPGLYLYDLLWMASDPRHQGIRDKLAGTFVVRAEAQPAGRTVIGYALDNLYPFSLITPSLGSPGRELRPAETARPAVGEVRAL